MKIQYANLKISYVLAAFRLVLHKLVNVIFPPSCIKCKALIDEPQLLCSNCWGELNFISEPKCFKCSRPINYYKVDSGCGDDCRYKKASYHRILVSLSYDQEVAGIVHSFKYQDRVEYAKPMARILYNAIHASIKDIEVIVPVPLHISRLRKRKYNQAALLAKQISKLSGIRYIPNALVRTKKTLSQSSLGKKQRLTNIKGAFVINSKKSGCILGKKVLLVDDVVTTGATAEECTKCLKGSGARQVTVAAIAKA